MVADIYKSSPTITSQSTGKLMNLTQEYQLVVLQPQGCLDSDNSKTFREQLASLVPQPHQLWVIDLSKVDFIDSSGLAVLVNGFSAARSSGCRLVICNMQAPVRIIFELTQLSLVFEIFDSYDTVLDKFNP